MLNKRLNLVLKAALIYANANLSDLNDSFAEIDEECEHTGNLTVDGNTTPPVQEEEIQELLKLLQE